MSVAKLGDRWFGLAQVPEPAGGGTGCWVAEAYLERAVVRSDENLEVSVRVPRPVDLPLQQDFRVRPVSEEATAPTRHSQTGRSSKLKVMPS